MKRGFILIIGLMLILSACQQQASDQPTDSTEPEVIELGFIGPLTGDAASYGLPLQKVVQLAVEEINANGGIDGKQVKVIYEDGECAAKGATNAINKLINVNKIKIILGGLCSGETLGAAPIAEQNQVILFSAASSSPDVTNAGDFVFRNFPSDATSGNKVAEAMYNSGYTKVATLSELSDYAQAVRRVFIEKYESLGGEVVADEKYDPADSDFKTQILKMKNSEPDAVYIVPQTPAKLGLAVQQINELNVNKPLYSNEFLAAQDILDQYGQYIEGGVFAEPYFDETAEMAAKLLADYETTYNEVPGGALPNSYYASQYDAVYIIKEAIETVGYETIAIRDYLYAIDGRQGAAGLLTMDENGDPITEYLLKKIENGEPIFVN